jgi:serine protease
MLGTVRTATARNRAIPLFSMYSPGATDYAAVATPQNAMSLVRYTAAAYATVPSGGNFIGGVNVPGYTAFPSETGTPSPVPRTNAYVLSTEYSPAIESVRQLTPLYLLDRVRNWPLNCNPVTQPATCNANNRDYILLTSTARINSAVAAGYSYRGLQGYVFTTQALGTQALNLQCRISEDDCAVFLEDQRTQFEAAGYTALFPSATTSILGYAYGTSNSDGDALPDAMEYAIGTNPNATDSDGDGLSDSAEYPLTTVSNSDPCSGPSITCLAPAPFIFANGFE